VLAEHHRKWLIGASTQSNGLDRAYTEPEAFARQAADDSPLHHDNIRGRDYYH
jgi:hypothetical protein